MFGIILLSALAFGSGVGVCFGLKFSHKNQELSEQSMSRSEVPLLVPKKLNTDRETTELEERISTIRNKRQARIEKKIREINEIIRLRERDNQLLLASWKGEV